MPQESFSKRNIVAGLDVGTSKVVLFIGEIKPGGKLEIIGKDEKPSNGLRNGVVVDIESTRKSIEDVIKGAELLAGFKITSANVGIVGTHISSRDTEGMVAISNQEVTQDDIDRVLNSARTIALEKDQQILHLIPQEYIIDHQEGITKPIGMSGVRLETKVHMVTCASSALQNLKKCVERSGVMVDAFILQPLASSVSVLVEDEKELGVVVVDIGAGTTDIAIFVEGSVRYTATVPIAGAKVTKDIALVLRTPQADAEHIKLEYGCAHPEMSDPDQFIKVTGVGGRDPIDLSVEELMPIIEARYTELLKAVQEKIIDSGYEKRLRAGVVLTGGGSTVYGLTELASDIFGIPVRLGHPLNVDTVVSDATELKYATGVGLLKYAIENKLNNLMKQQSQEDAPKASNNFINSASRFLRNISKNF